MNFNPFSGKKEKLETLPKDKLELEKEGGLVEGGISPAIFTQPFFRDVILEQLYKIRKEDPEFDPTKKTVVYKVDFFKEEILEKTLRVMEQRRKDKSDAPIIFDDLAISIPLEDKIRCQKYFNSIKNFDGLEWEEVELVKEITDRIDQTNNFEELYGIIDSLEEIPGPNGNYSSEKVKKEIEKLRNHEDGSRIKKIPRIYGLRKKVQELLNL